MKPILETRRPRTAAGESLDLAQQGSELLAVDNQALRTVANAPAMQQAGSERARVASRLVGDTGILELRGSIDRQTVGNVRRALRALSSAASILVEIESRGGSVAGVADLFDEFLALRGRTRVVAFAGDVVLGSAYWLAAAATEVVVGQAAEVGGIGVGAIMFDASRRRANEGVDAQVAKAGPQGPDSRGRVTDGQRAALQRQAEAALELFVSAVARGRRLLPARVRELADGGVLLGEQAVRAGLADRVGTIDQALAITGAAPPSRSSRPAARRRVRSSTAAPAEAGSARPTQRAGAAPRAPMGARSESRQPPSSTTSENAGRRPPPSLTFEDVELALRKDGEFADRLAQVPGAFEELVLRLWKQPATRRVFSSPDNLEGYLHGAITHRGRF